MDGDASPSFDTPTLATRASLLLRLRDVGDHAAWQRFFDTYWPLLYTVARRFGLNDAEAQDVVQETVIDVCQQMPEFEYERSRGRFKNWLLVIVRRRTQDFLRRKQYKHEGRLVAREQRLDTLPDEGAQSTENVFDQIWAEEWERHRLQLALEMVKQQVKPLQFQMFQLHVFKELAVDEVCARLGVRATEVYWAKYRLGRRLARALRELG